MLVKGRQLDLIKKLAKRWEKKLQVIPAGQLGKLMHNPERQVGLGRVYRTRTAEIVLFPRGFDTYRVYYVKSKTGRKPLVIKHHNVGEVSHEGDERYTRARSEEFKKEVFFKQDALHERGHPVAKPIRLLHAPPDRNWKHRDRLIQVESFEGISVEDFPFLARTEKERKAIKETVAEILEKFWNKNRKLAKGHYHQNIVINPKTGKVSRIDIADILH